MDEPVTPEVQVVLAAVTGAHGVTGEVRLKLFGEGISSLKPHKAFNVSGNDSALTLTKLHDDGKGGAIARFAEVADRTAAEAPARHCVDRPALDPPAVGRGRILLRRPDRAVCGLDRW